VTDGGGGLAGTPFAGRGRMGSRGFRAAGQQAPGDLAVRLSISRQFLVVSGVRAREIWLSATAIGCDGPDSTRAVAWRGGDPPLDWLSGPGPKPP
jgi:hypothetical protein